MKFFNNTKGVILFVAFMGVFCATLLLTPYTVFGQDVSPIDAVPTEPVTLPQEPLPTQAPVDSDSPSTVTLPTDEPNIPSDFTWDYSLDFPQFLNGNANEFVTDLNLQGVLGKVISTDELKITGANDSAKFRSVLFPQNKTGLGLIDGAGEINLEFPVTQIKPISLTLETNFSTGYRWQIVTAKLNDKSLQHSTAIVTRAEGALVQEQVITFTPNSKGTAQIKLTYRRSFTPSEDSTRFLKVTYTTQPGSIDLSNPAPDLSVPINNFSSGEMQSSSGSDVSINAATLPSTWDWRSFGAVTPVRDQGSYGTCWAFSTIGTDEANILVNGGPALDLSEQYLVSCNKEGWTANSGGYPVHKYNMDILGNNQTVAGAVLEADMPYSPARATCKTISNHAYKLSGWSYFTYSTADTEAIKSAIYTHGPVSSGVCVGPKFSGYSNGYYTTDESSLCNGSINHYIVLVGWKDISPTEGYWILRNSWGSNWGESGYMYIKYGISSVGTWASWVDYTATNSPSTIAPSGTVQTMNPIYQWNAVSGATNYEVQVLQNSTVLIDNSFTSSVCSGSTCSTKLSKSIGSGDYFWRVKAKVGGVWGTYTRPFTFTVANQPPMTPVTVNPSGNQTTKPATFTWKVSPGATKYTISIYSYASKATVLSKTIAAATYCTSSTCTYTPSLTYASDVYYFKVAAINSFGTSAYSAVKKFSFCSTTGFNSQFNQNHACWYTYSGGNWQDSSSSFLSAGKTNYWSSTAYPVTFANFTYSAKIKRVSTASKVEEGLIFRGTYAIDSKNRWKNGYFFTYKNDGTFKISKIVNGTEKILQNWKSSPAIKKNDWNLLKVVASGNTFTCYINNVQVWKGTDSQFASGRAGFTFYNDAPSQIFYIDYATLAKQ